MLVTEKTAKEVFCPYMFGVKFSTHFCIGSKCMAWRWAGWEEQPTRLIKPTPHQPHDIDEARLGFCGLAGKPYGAP